MATKNIRTCTLCNATVPDGCFHDPRTWRVVVRGSGHNPDQVDHVPVPLNVKPSSDPRKVKVLFDAERDGWMGFEVPDSVSPAWYSSLDTLPRSLRTFVTVSGKLCSEAGCFNNRWRRHPTCRKHTIPANASRAENGSSAAGQRGSFAQKPGAVGSLHVPVPERSQDAPTEVAR